MTREARILNADGSETPLKPKEEKFRILELMSACGGSIRTVFSPRIQNDERLLTHLHAADQKLPLNAKASELAGVDIFGNAILVPTELLETADERRKRRENPEFLYVNIHNVWTKTRSTEKGSEGDMLEGGFILDWGAKGMGFGQLEFRQFGPDVRNLKIECRTETMGEDFAKQALAFFAASMKVVE